MRFKLDRGFLYMPAVFLLGFQAALIWVSGTLEYTFDLWKPGIRIPTEVLDRERHTVLDARSNFGLLGSGILLVTIVFDGWLMRRRRDSAEDPTQDETAAT